MAQNKIQAFATSDSANVLTDEQLSGRSELQTGFPIRSKADSALIGKLIQNATAGAYAVAEFTAKNSNTDISGSDPTGFTTAFESAVKNITNDCVKTNTEFTSAIAGNNIKANNSVITDYLGCTITNSVEENTNYGLSSSETSLTIGATGVLYGDHADVYSGLTVNGERSDNNIIQSVDGDPTIGVYYKNSLVYDLTNGIFGYIPKDATYYSDIKQFAYRDEIPNTDEFLKKKTTSGNSLGSYSNTISNNFGSTEFSCSYNGAEGTQYETNVVIGMPVSYGNAEGTEWVSWDGMIISGNNSQLVGTGQGDYLYYRSNSIIFDLSNQRFGYLPIDSTNIHSDFKSFAFTSDIPNTDDFVSKNDSITRSLINDVNIEAQNSISSSYTGYTISSECSSTAKPDEEFSTKIYIGNPVLIPKDDGSLTTFQGIQIRGGTGSVNYGPIEPNSDTSPYYRNAIIFDVYNSNFGFFPKEASDFSGFKRFAFAKDLESGYILQSGNRGELRGYQKYTPVTGSGVAIDEYSSNDFTVIDAQDQTSINIGVEVFSEQWPNSITVKTVIIKNASTVTSLNISGDNVFYSGGSAPVLNGKNMIKIIITICDQDILVNTTQY